MNAYAPPVEHRKESNMDNLYVDMSPWTTVRITGGDRARFLNGLTTINVPKLTAGETQWGAILNPKGRVMSVFELHAAVDHFDLRCEPALAEKTMALLTRYAVMDDVNFEATTEVGYRLWSQPNAPWTARFVAGVAPQATVAFDSEPATRLRVAAGFMRYGIDVDEDCFPFETPLAHFLDYEKGCYVGQEPVFRVHAQGNAARALRVVHITGEAPVPAGATLAHPTRSNAGELTSLVAAGDHWLVLAYLHRTVLDQTDGFTVDGRPATIHLPVVA